jgi:DNA adenine methylase
MSIEVLAPSNEKLVAPFPYFGGKRRVADLVWRALGSDLDVFTDPFCGSAAILLANPNPVTMEVINDFDYYITNFWRAAKYSPEMVAQCADYPVTEADATARHQWLVTVGAESVRRVADDPEYYDSKVAGWWLYGLCTWRGREWCAKAYSENKRVWRQLPRHARTGINKRAMLEFNSEDEFPVNLGLIKYMNRIAHRLRNVLVTNGSWDRVVTPGMTTNVGLTGVFLDPPYSAKAQRDNSLYAVESTTVAQDVYRWCRENEHDPKLRIVLCGYEGEFEFPDTWRTIEWRTSGGYGNTKRTDSEAKGASNKIKERLWLSPNCLPIE